MAVREIKYMNGNEAINKNTRNKKNEIIIYVVIFQSIFQTWKYHHLKPPAGRNIFHSIYRYLESTMFLLSTAKRGCLKYIRSGAIYFNIDKCVTIAPFRIVETFLQAYCYHANKCSER